MKSYVKVGAVCIFSLLLVFTFTAQSFADWPGNKPISVVISYKAGGGTDTMTRAYTSAMEDFIGTTINSMNRPGAVGALAMDFVASKPSDGYWWQGASNFNKSLRVMGHTKLSWRDWQYFKAANSTQSFAVRPDSPFKTMDDFIAAAKKDPGKYKINGSGVGGLWSEGVALLESTAGIKLRTVQYKGGKPGVLSDLSCQWNGPETCRRFRAGHGRFCPLRRVLYPCGQERHACADPEKDRCGICQGLQLT